MSQERHEAIQQSLESFDFRALVHHWVLDTSGGSSKYLIWVDSRDDAPAVMSMMAAEAFIHGVETADYWHTVRKSSFTVTQDGIVFDHDS